MLEFLHHKEMHAAVDELGLVYSFTARREFLGFLVAFVFCNADKWFARRIFELRNMGSPSITLSRLLSTGPVPHLTRPTPAPNRCVYTAEAFVVALLATRWSNCPRID
jgi:hypothetical protein